MLSLDVEAIRDRIDQRFGGNAAAVISHWPTPDPPYRGTITRWLQQKSLPRTEEQLLSLAGALDLDPFALWSVTPATFPALCARLISLVREGRWSRLLPALSFGKTFRDFMSQWPPSGIARRYFDRDWIIKDFVHSAATHRNYFAALSIELPHRKEGGMRNQVLHFAWSDPMEGALWRPYGFVKVSGSEVSLYSFNGYLDRGKVDPAKPSFFVETWFGEGAARFRIASLHGFQQRMCAAIPAGSSTVRFGFPKLQ